MKNMIEFRLAGISSAAAERIVIPLSNLKLAPFWYGMNTCLTIILSSVLCGLKNIASCFIFGITPIPRITHWRREATYDMPVFGDSHIFFLKSAIIPSS